MKNLHDLEREIALCDELIDESDEPHLTAKLLDLQGKLKEKHAKLEILGNRVLHIDAVRRVFDLMVQAVNEEIKALPDWENVEDRIRERFIAAMGGAENTAPEKRKLIERR